MEKLKDINMTDEEIDRFVKAFQDERFRGLLFDYAKELSDPENQKRYEAELKQLESERGNYIEFIHPEPFKVLKTSVDGKQKCFVNICSNEKINKPEFKWVVEDGRRGQQWSVPHSLAPGRTEKNPKGVKYTIYDVVFHPDTIHMASRSKRFMDLVDNTAVQGIQDGFKVTLDKNNLRELTIKYKGSPQTCVISRPIPGYTPQESKTQPDPLAFAYPEEKKLTPAKTDPSGVPKPKDGFNANTKPGMNPKPKGDGHATTMEPVVTPAPKHSGNAKVKTDIVPKPQEPTIPKYKLTYRSFIDMIDFRHSRDSAQSPRPKEIIVTVDMPLLKAANDTHLEVKDKSLLLESQEPAYRLELALAYPVDEEKGQAKFNKQKRQLTITLPVVASQEKLDLIDGGSTTGSEDGNEKEDGVLEEEKLNLHNNDGDNCSEDERKTGEEEKNETNGKINNDEWRCNQATQNENSYLPALAPVSTGDNFEDIQHMGLSTDNDQKELDLHVGRSTEEDNAEAFENQKMVSQDTEDWTMPNLENTDKLCDTSGGLEENSASPESSVELRAQVDTPEVCEESEITAENEDRKLTKMETDTGVVNDDYSETSATVASHSEMSDTAAGPLPGTDHNNNHLTKDCSMFMERAEVQETGETLREDSQINRINTSEEVAPDPDEDEKREEMDEDDLPTEQTFPSQEQHHQQQQPAVLREIASDGTELVISDRSTSAGFTFQNSLLYELD